ncbi:MAG: MoaD/ThiS family protein [Candidatus Thiodiazotropha endolucinida]
MSTIQAMPTLSFTSNLTRHTPCPDAAFEAATVAQLFDLYFSQWPDVRSYVLDDQGAVRNHVIVMVDGRGLHDRRRLSDALGSESEVFVIQALSGG